jgi:hypothetical protein
MTTPLLAHGINPVLLFSFWGLLFVSVVVGLVILWSECWSRTRRHAQLVGSVFCLLVGAWVAYFAIEDGALRDPNWFTAVSAAPLVLGIITLLIWMRLKPQKG